MYGWWIIGLLGVVGHFALHLTIYNRINATGLPRGIIRLIKYFFLGTCITIPIASVTLWPGFLRGVAFGSATLDQIPMPVALYGGVTLLTLVVFGPVWLMSRPALNRDAMDVASVRRRVSVPQALGKSLALTRKCRVHANLPLNQLFELSIEHKEIPVAGLPAALDGMKVAHLSDIHLTGHVSPDFYRYAVEQATEWGPDLLALTGDIVDKERCIPWLDDCFSTAKAGYGCYFVLGNHDLRVRRPASVRERLTTLGWCDLGGREVQVSIHGTTVQLIGNESPWFPAPAVAEADNSDGVFRMLLSHSPDQIQWARKRHIDLMLAGHTHGGQGRLPWIGPVLSPSYYGSRYASGSFHMPPTTMHVSRGLSGVHLMRINCPPELALLTLRAVAGR